MEQDALGGVCLNWGCIPTKALLACAEALETIREAKEFGIEVADPVPNLAAMIERKNGVSETLRKGIAQLLKAMGVGGTAAGITDAGVASALAGGAGLTGAGTTALWAGADAAIPAIAAGAGDALAAAAPMMLALV